MSFCFRMDEPVEQGLRRIAGAQIDDALDQIRAPDLPVERVIHEVRKRCKALRALVRLVRPCFPGFAQENAAFRDIAGALAGLRDNQVLLDTLEMLARPDEEATEQAVTARLRKRFAPPHSEAGTARATLDRCAGQLAEARARVATWTLEADGWDAIGPGFHRTAKAARRDMQTLATCDDPQRSHDWRKHVKYHWHQMRLLKEAGPEAAKKRADLAERLTILLGSRHDLDLFAETLASQPRRGTEMATLDLLTARARKRAAKLERKALRLGERLFDEKPGKLADKWGERWRARAQVEEAA